MADLSGRIQINDQIVEVSLLISQKITVRNSDDHFLGGRTIFTRVQQSPSGGSVAQHRPNCQIDAGPLSTWTQVRSTSASHGGEYDRLFERYYCSFVVTTADSGFFVVIVFFLIGVGRSFLPATYTTTSSIACSNSSISSSAGPSKRLSKTGHTDTI